MGLARMEVIEYLNTRVEILKNEIEAIERVIRGLEGGIQS